MFRRKNIGLGLSLLEMMLALVLTTIIFLSLLSVYGVAKTNFQIQAYLHQTQDDERMASLWLTMAVASAGYAGCLILPHRIHGTDDSLTVLKMGLPKASLSLAMQNDNTIFVSHFPRFESRAYLLISDCLGAEYFQAQSVGEFQHRLQMISSATPLKRRYKLWADVGTAESYRYYCGATKRKTVKQRTIYALYRVGRSGRSEELVEGVSAMQIRYAERRLKTVVIVQAKDVMNWEAVVGVHITLDLMDTEERFPVRQAYVHAVLQEPSGV